MLTSSHIRCLFLAVCAVAALAASPPNFVVIVVDDMGYNDLGIYGSPTIATPNLDRLAIEGTRFSQFYSAAPICTPSRAALMTGRLPIRTGIYTNYSYPLDDLFRVFMPNSAGCLPENETTVATYLGNAGYYTALVGKWHIGHNPKRNCMPTRKGFSYFYGLPYSHEEGFPGPEFPESMVFPPVPLMQNDATILQQPVDLEALTPRYTEQVLALLDIASGNKPNPTPVDPITPAPASGQPFLLHVAYEEPHIPLFAAPSFQNVSRRGHYGDAVQQMDNSVGQIIAKLKSTGLDANTYVIFTSDNGAWIHPGTGLTAGNPLDGGSNAPFFDGKGSTWEGGLREPAIVWAPGRVPAGQSLMQPVTMMDIMPTLLDIAQLPIPDNLDGVSIANLLNGTSTADPHDYIYMWREHVLYAIRGGPWKAHFWTRPGFGFVAPVEHNPPLLFNVEQDPGEQFPFNVTAQPELQPILDGLIAAANAHVASIVPGVSQYEALDWSIMPCCGKTYNITEATEFFSKGYVGLAIWDSCVCSNATTRPNA